MSTKLGMKIKELRKNKSLTLQALADKVGSSKSYMWELENKGTAHPSALVLTKIAKVLMVTPEFLVDDEQVELSNNHANQAFFRKYEKLDDKTKNKLNKFLEMLEDED